MSAAPEASAVKRALSAHAAVGLIAGALLYLVCLTGTLSVFYAEWQRIEQPRAPEMAAIAPEAVQRGVVAVLATERGKPATSHLYVHLPVEDLPRATITTDSRAVHLREDGWLAGPEEIGWSDFLLQLHYTLNLPSLVGLSLVGALGVMILVLALSGVVAHPRIFRDAFRLRARDTEGVGLADWHNRLSVWTLPFSIAVALTGALIGLASLTAYGVAAAHNKGDIAAVYAPIFGAEGKPDKAAAAVPNVAAALRDLRTRFPAVVPTYVTIHDPLTAGQHIQISAEHRRRLIFGEYYAYDASGHYQGSVGLADGEIGQQAAASTYKLHFGNYGGLPVKLAHLLFGAALTAICATGVYIWLGKRRRRGVHEPRLHAAWNAVVWGTPLALATTVLARMIVGNAAPFATIFWTATVLAVAFNVLRSRRT